MSLLLCGHSLLFLFVWYLVTNTGVIIVGVFLRAFVLYVLPYFFTTGGSGRQKILEKLKWQFLLKLINKAHEYSTAPANCLSLPRGALMP